MKCLKFNVYGRYAHFLNPENNNYVEFTFEHIFKPCVLGLLGGILGLDGRGEMKKNDNKIMYYELLKNIKISIVPDKPKFNKFKDTFTNSTGFGNKDEQNKGATQIKIKTILENPGWTIYVSKDSMDVELYDKLSCLLKNQESVYPIFLGMNNYKARIRDVEEIDIEEIIDTEDVETIDSIFECNIVDEVYTQTLGDIPYDITMYLPKELNEKTLYKYEKMRYSNYWLSIKNADDLYNFEDKVLQFI